MSEGVSEAPIFMEWCTKTIVVPTYPEGGSHALQVCQQQHRLRHQVVRVALREDSATLSGCRRLKEHVARDCSGRFG